jgi:hypothetical protein
MGHRGTFLRQAMSPTAAESIFSIRYSFAMGGRWSVQMQNSPVETTGERIRGLPQKAAEAFGAPPQRLNSRRGNESRNPALSSEIREPHAP